MGILSHVMNVTLGMFGLHVACHSWPEASWVAVEALNILFVGARPNRGNGYIRSKQWLNTENR